MDRTGSVRCEGRNVRPRLERWRKLGIDVDMRELVYHGERSHLIRYLEAGGRHVSADSVPDLYAANGLTPPDGERGAAMANVKCITATLHQGA